MDYDVPQMRKRNIFLISRKDMKYIWQVPPKKKIITLREAIYDIPSVETVQIFQSAGKAEHPG